MNKSTSSRQSIVLTIILLSILLCFAYAFELGESFGAFLAHRF